MKWLVFISVLWSMRSANAQGTATLGAFITPVKATASSAQEGAGRTARRLIDGSGWEETRPGSGVYVHTADVGADGASMWNGDVNSWLLFDLGQAYNVRGLYVWNYNERGEWRTRGVKEMTILASNDGQQFTPAGDFTLELAPGEDDYKGQAIAFAAPVRTRYFKFQIKSNYRGGENSGLSEVRFANADVKAAPPVPPKPWQPTYPRPTYFRRALGQPSTKAENIVYPADAGLIDVTKVPYNAKGDGVADDTAAIQQAFNDHPNQGAIIYLPNGIYRVSAQLRWPHGKGNGDEEKNTLLQGQSRAGTVLQLRDGCPGFDNPRHPQGVIWTGQAPAQRFCNEIHNLTVDTGVNNPGACGIQFIANNQGGVYDVAIVSGDGQGVAGLDMGYTNEQGPCLIHNVSVTGFDIGIHTATSVASETLEHIIVQHQNRYGMRNDGQPCTVRDLHSLNAVPAFYAGGGFNTLLDSTFEGVGAAAGQPAIVNEAALMARHIHTHGYGLALENDAGAGGKVVGPEIAQFLSKPASSLFGEPTPPLQLPIEETPTVPWDDPKTWAGPQHPGVAEQKSADDSAAIQAAIDAGATTVYLPRGNYRIGHTIVIRGPVRRLIGCRAWFDIVEPLRSTAQPVFRFEDGPNAPPVTVVEGISTDFSSGPYWFMDNNARRTLVMRRLAINFGAADAYHGNSSGHVFIEDVVGRYFHFKGQTVWGRQFNPEGDGTHISNDGGTLWILGLKTEGGGTLVATSHGGRSEILGGFSYTVGPGKLAPMFTIDDAQASISFAEVNYTGDPFATIVRETQGGITREMPHTDARWGGHFTLFRAGK